MIFSKPIVIGLSPNTESDDISLAQKNLFKPWTWKKGEAEQQLRTWFSKTYDTDYVFTYNSARSALFHIIQAFGIGKGDEVIIQSFTCVAVPNSIVWNGATPVYSDISDDFNLDPTLLESHINSHTKAIIVQHTFGIPAEIEVISKIAKKHNLVLIEDCAHSLGATSQHTLLGTYGDAAIFSFGRDKVLSSVFGGVGIILKDNQMAAEKMNLLWSSLPYNSAGWIFQQVFHPVAMSWVLPLYSSGIGKGILVMLQKLNALSFPVYTEEKKGKRPSVFPAKFPNVLCILAMHQLKKLQRFNNQRKTVSNYYRQQLQISNVTLPPLNKDAIFLRFPIRVKNSKKILRDAKKRGILLGNWYHSTIDPNGSDLEAISYKIKSCPVAENYAETIVNLPTRISLHDAEKVINVVKSSI